MDKILIALLLYLFFCWGPFATLLLLFVLLRSKIVELNSKTLLLCTFVFVYMTSGFMGLVYLFIMSFVVLYSAVTYWYNIPFNDVDLGKYRTEYEKTYGKSLSFGLTEKLDYLDNEYNKKKNHYLEIVYNKVGLDNEKLDKFKNKGKGIYMYVSQKCDKLCDYTKSVMVKVYDKTKDKRGFVEVYNFIDQVRQLCEFIETMRKMNNLARSLEGINEGMNGEINNEDLTKKFDQLTENDKKQINEITKEIFGLSSVDDMLGMINNFDQVFGNMMNPNMMNSNMKMPDKNGGGNHNNKKKKRK